MTVLDAVREAFLVDHRGRYACGRCDHFSTDPALLERELPGLAVFSSAAAAIRADDGLCLKHNRIINGQRRCASFTTVRKEPGCPVLQQ